MNKRHILLTLACIATITSQGQISYQKYYDKAQKQTAVEGTLSDDSVRIGDWTWWHPSGHVYQQGHYDSHGKNVRGIVHVQLSGLKTHCVRVLRSSIIR